jgi:hypothetical protein
MGKNVINTLLVVLLFYFAPGCSKQKELTANTSGFENSPQSTRVEPPIREASGIADCTTSAALWVIEDSGNPADLLLLQKDGRSVKHIPLQNAYNTDWEDLIRVAGDLYIADMGDNGRVRKNCTIYRFPEPEASADTIYNYQTIRFTYPDGAHDAEGFLVDPTTKDIFIITKSGQKSGVYKLPFPYRYTEVDTLIKQAELPYNGVTSTTLSEDSREILVKTYQKVFYYQRQGTETIDQALTKTPREISYQVEPQGEALTFAHDGSGFYTLSEKGMSNSVNLHFYKRR